MTHKGTVKLETKRLILRRFTIDDAEDVFQRWSGSAENSRFVMRSPHLSVTETKEMLQEYIRNYDKPDFYMWGIVFEGNLIGYICGNEMNEEIKSICVGYCITKSCWNKGITTEATKVVIDFFFSIGFNRIFSYHNPLNPASGKVMQKCGMRFEGRIRGGSMLAGKICDCLQYAILVEDYFGKQQKGKIICIHGTICSGKTYYAKRLAKERHAVVLSIDEILVPLFGIYLEQLKERTAIASKYFLEKALEIMEVGTPVILDWGFWNRSDRKETTDYFARHGFNVEWHGITITDEALRRNVQSRYKEMAAGRVDIYPADENLLAKAADIIEAPAEEEMNVWIKVE